MFFFFRQKTAYEVRISDWSQTWALPISVAVKNSPPDGYTLFLGTSTALSVNQSLYPDLPYNPQKDFESIVLASFLPSIVAVPSSLPVKRSEEHTSELQSLMRTSYALFCLKKKHHKQILKYNIDYIEYINMSL